MQTQVTRGVRFLKEWAADPARRAVVRDANFAALRESLGNGREIWKIVSRSQGYGTWLCGSGQARVLAGDTGGWSEFRAGVAVQRAGLTLAFRRFARGEFPKLKEPFLPQAAAHVTALALALDDPKAAELSALSLAAWPSGTTLETYPTFVQALAAKSLGTTAYAAKCGPPYGAVLENWAGAGLAAALSAALDYHVAHSKDSRNEVREFADIPVLVFPAEVLALIAIQRRQGEPVRAISHALLSTPLAEDWLGGRWTVARADESLLPELERFAAL